MNEGKKPAPPSDFDARLHQALERRRDGDGKRPDTGGDPRSGLSLALRIGIELVAALMVGTGIGYLLDQWWGSKPWAMIVFFVLGSAAGLMNVMRVMKGMNDTVGYRGKDRGKTPAVVEDDEDEG
jgi:ATP synthase protein I